MLNAELGGMAASEWVAIGLFVASILFSLFTRFVFRRESWRAEVDKEREVFRRKFDIIHRSGIDLSLDD